MENTGGRLSQSDLGRAHCPGYEELQAFYAGQLPEGRWAAIISHLSTCRACETLVASFARQDSTAAVATRDRFSQQPVEEPALRDGPAPVVPDAAACGASSGDDSEGTDISGSLASPQTETWKAPVGEERPAIKAVPSLSDKPTLPEKIGPYFVVRLLGSGGFGLVYLARRGSTDQQVAIKVPKAGPRVTEAEIQNFLHEARTVAELAHPAIVQVRDFLRLPDYGCCIEMPYYSGGSLKDLLRKERVSHTFAAQLIADLAEALHQAHSRRIFHRDIKPANVLLDHEGRPHLTDFGLAMLDGDRWQHRGELAGTRGYMSPEQVIGKAEFIDGRTDVWSLGVMLYEMLTRERPFRGRTTDQVTQEIFHKRPNPRVLDAVIPEALERICTKCLAQDLNQRYANTLDVAQDLRQWLDSTRPDRGSRRRRGLLAAVAGLVLLGSIVAIGGLWNRGGRDPAAPGAPPQAQGAATQEGAGADRAPLRESPAAESMVLAPHAHDPLGWRDRLGQLPRELLWPGYRGASSLGFRPELRAYEVASSEVRLVELGSFSGTQLSSRTVSAGIKQPVWMGGAGLFFGLHMDTCHGRPCSRFQVIGLSKDADPQGKDVLKIGRSIFVINPGTGMLETQMRFGARTVDWPGPGGPTRLELQFQQVQGRFVLVAARWGNVELDQLAGSQIDANIAATEDLGSWGLFSQFATTWLYDPLVTP